MRAWVLVLALAGAAWAQPVVEDTEGRGLSPSPAAESPDAWLERRAGLKVGLQLGAGLSALVGAPVSYGLGRVSVYVMPELQFQWPFVFTTAAFFLGVEAGVLVHVGRRFSFGAGGLIGLHLGALWSPVPGFSVTPVMVHLGERDQHTVLIYVPWVLNPYPMWPLPMVGYAFRFN